MWFKQQSQGKAHFFQSIEVQSVITRYGVVTRSRLQDVQVVFVVWYSGQEQRCVVGGRGDVTVNLITRFGKACFQVVQLPHYLQLPRNFVHVNTSFTEEMMCRPRHLSALRLAGSREFKCLPSPRRLGNEVLMNLSAPDCAVLLGY